MQKQIFLAIFTDETGKQLDFERFCCRRVSTVERKIKQLMSFSIYQAIGATKVNIYRTEYSREGLEPEAVVIL